MLQSPAKRRKISPSHSVAADGNNTENAQPSHPTTPTRASYASPTKSSLARSHPHILSRSPGRSTQSAGKGKALRQKLLGRKSQQNSQATATVASQSAPQTPQHGDAASRKAPPTVAAAPPDALSAAVARAFEVQGQPKPAPRSPLTSRQPSAQTNAQQRRASSIDDLPNFVMPKLVQRPTSALPEISRTRSNDLDLPPTPVQLGLDMAPDRPRGLASSSSPRSGRSGSGKNRRRFRDGAVTSSPLKPKDQAPRPNQTRENVPPQIPVEEAPESEAGEQQQQDSVPEVIRQKLALRKVLEAQLERLRKDMSTLESVLNANDQHRAIQSGTDLLALLTTTNPSCAVIAPTSELQSSISSLPNPIHLGPKPLPYLTLFAAGNLQLSTKTISRASKHAAKLQTIHTLTLTAPAPWPPQLFSAVIEVKVDAQAAQVTSVQLKQPRNASWSATHHKKLFAWMAKRLDHPLHKYDVGTLVWGMGRYFDECVRRAKTMVTLERNYKTIGSHSSLPGYDSRTSQLTPDDAKALIPYMTTAQMELEVNASSSQRGKRKRTRGGAKLLLSWDVTLDWTGEADAKIDVAATGLPAKAVEGINGVWDTLKKRKGVLGAVEDVLAVLKDEHANGL